MRCQERAESRIRFVAAYARPAPLILLALAIAGGPQFASPNYLPYEDTDVRDSVVAALPVPYAVEPPEVPAATANGVTLGKRHPRWLLWHGSEALPAGKLDTAMAYLHFAVANGNKGRETLAQA